MHIALCNSDDKQYQRGWNALVTMVFQDFSFWLDQNLWDTRYESYAIVEEGTFLSNINVFKTALLWDGKPVSALSIGAVCTHPAHRGKGYSRRLMEHILNRYPNTPMYLSANDSVLNFYPKFGFEPAYEKLPVIEASLDGTTPAVQLAYADPKVWAYVHGRVNFSAVLDCTNTDIVTMFDVRQDGLEQCLYELPDIQTMIVARQSGETLRLIGVFALRPVTWSQIMPRLPFAGVRRVEFGFMPDALDVGPHTMEACQGEVIFIRGTACNVSDRKFPELSWT